MTKTMLCATIYKSYGMENLWHWEALNVERTHHRTHGIGDNQIKRKLQVCFMVCHIHMSHNFPQIVDVARNLSGGGAKKSRQTNRNLMHFILRIRTQ